MLQSRRQPSGHRERAFRPVHDVEVVTRSPVREQIADLGERPLDADQLDDVGVFGGNLQARGQLFWQRGTAQAGETLHLLERKYRHDAGHDRHGDAACMAPVDVAVVG